MYKEYEVYIPVKEKKRLQSALRKEKRQLKIIIHLNKGNFGGGEKEKLLLTKKQIKKLEKIKKNVSITMSTRQVRANIKYEGGFLSVLAGLTGRVLPTVLAGVSSGLLSGLVEKAVSGNGLYLQKGGYCYKTEPVEGNGLYLSPHAMLKQGDGLFLKHGDNIFDGSGFLLGPNSPFKDIPLLGLIL